MNRLPLFLILITAGFSKGQNKDRFDIVSNVETRVVWMKALGNNTMAKDMNAFFGVGFGGQLMTPTRFGVGLDYNLLFSDVKYGRENYFGNLGSQTLHNFDFYLVHKEELSEDFSLEESFGVSFYKLKSILYPGNETYIQGRGGFNLGLKAVFNVDLEGHQNIFAGIRGNSYSSGVVNEDPHIQNYYRKSFFIGFSFGYRYQF